MSTSSTQRSFHRLWMSAMLTGACARCSPTADVGPDTAIVGEAGDDTSSGSDVLIDVATDVADASASAWRLVPGGEECQIYVGDVDQLAFAPPAWTPCGAGCLTTPGPATGFAQMYQGNSSGGVVGGRVLLRRVMGDGVTGGPNRQQVVRIDDGATLAVIEQRAKGCVVLGNAPATPTALVYGQLRPQPFLLAGRASASGGPPLLATKWISAPAVAVTEFEYDGGLGWGFRSGAVSALPSSTDALVAIDMASIQPRWAFGRRGFVVWPIRLSDRSELRGWRGAGSAQTYVLEKDLITAAAQSDTHIAWIVASGPDADSGRFDSATIRWSKQPSLPADVVATTGPVLIANSGLGDLQVGGDFAATIGSVSGQPGNRLIVIQLSTKRVWSLRGASTDFFNAVFAIDADGSEIIVGVTDAPGTYANEVRRILRLKTAKLDELASTW